MTATFKVWFTNFGYFSADESGTLEGAYLVCRQAGFQGPGLLAGREQRGDLLPHDRLAQG